MMSAAVSSMSSQNDESKLADLAETLETERKLLRDMQQVLIRQREGIASNDLGVLDDSVFAAQRVLLTLQQARRRRRSLLRLLGGSEDAPLGELDIVLGASFTASIERARDALVETAHELAREARVNRKVIAGAASLGDELMSLMLGGTQGPETYSPTKGRTSGARSGALVNTRA